MKFKTTTFSRIFAFSILAATTIGCIGDNEEDISSVDSEGYGGQLDAATVISNAIGNTIQADESRAYDYAYFLAVDVCQANGYDESYDDYRTSVEGEIRNMYSATNLLLECAIPLIYNQNEGYLASEISAIRMYGYCGHSTEDIEGDLYERGTSATYGSFEAGADISYTSSTEIAQYADFSSLSISSPFIYIDVDIPDVYSGRDSVLIGFRVQYSY